MESTTTEETTTAPTATLDQVFHSFSGGKKEMSNKEFIKLNKDCGLFDKKYTSTSGDLHFTKVKDKSSKTITYDQFQDALQLIAKSKGITCDDVVSMIISKGGPSYTGTKTDYVKFHDDKTTYTGVYAKGGPSTVDTQSGHISDISQLCDRTTSDVRGVKK
jgi:hypothetical protein